MKTEDSELYCRLEALLLGCSIATHVLWLWFGSSSDSSMLCISSFLDDVMFTHGVQAAVGVKFDIYSCLADFVMVFQNL